jgi:hypothetical protein
MSKITPANSLVKSFKKINSCLFIIRIRILIIRGIFNQKR